MRPDALRDEADDGAEGRRLAGAVAAEQRHHLALADLERDIEQDMRGAVEAVEVGDLELHAVRSLAVARVVDQAFAEIDGAHLRIAADLLRRALRDQAAAVEHQDAVGMLEHHVHVVLGEEHADRFFPRDPGREPHQLDPLARRHAGGRLVHQQQLRLVGERDRKLEPLEVAIGEFAAGPLGIAAHADEIEQPSGLLARELRRRGPEIEELPLVRHQRDLHVLAHRHGRKRRGDLESAPDAEPPDLARLAADGVLPEQRDAAAVRACSGR